LAFSNLEFGFWDLNLDGIYILWGLSLIISHLESGYDCGFLNAYLILFWWSFGVNLFCITGKISSIADPSVSLYWLQECIFKKMTRDLLFTYVKKFDWLIVYR
jgi:hypothetical protein